MGGNTWSSPRVAERILSLARADFTWLLPLPNNPNLQHLTTDRNHSKDSSLTLATAWKHNSCPLASASGSSLYILLILQTPGFGPVYEDYYEILPAVPFSGHRVRIPAVEFCHRAGGIREHHRYRK